MDKKRINPVRFPRNIDTDYIDQIIDWVEYLLERTEADYDREPMDHNVSPYVTVDGNRVRSMAKIIIYNTLRYHGINFRYESKLELNGLAGVRVVRYPDFTVVCCDGSMIYWEHAGMR